MRYPKAYYDALKLQRALMAAIADAKPGELAQMAKGFATLEEQKRKIRKEPPLKAVDSHTLNPSADMTFTGPLDG